MDACTKDICLEQAEGELRRLCSALETLTIAYDTGMVADGRQTADILELIRRNLEGIRLGVATIKRTHSGA